MNNDIKEILDNIKKCCEIMQDENFVVYQKQDIIKLLDYITNLQHTKEYLGEVLHEKDLELEDYKSRVEKALLIIEKTKEKMYKSRNKIAMFILIKLDNILNGKESD